MVYIGRKNGEAVHHTSLEAMKQIDGIDTPEMEISDEEFEAAECLVRIINDDFFFGKTNEEKTAEENERKIITLKLQLVETDYVAAKIAEGSATKAEYADIIAQRQSWRQEINNLIIT